MVAGAGGEDGVHGPRREYIHRWNTNRFILQLIIMRKIWQYLSGHISLARSAFAMSNLYHLPEGIVPIALRNVQVYHLPLGICLTCPIEFSVSRGILSNHHF